MSLLCSALSAFAQDEVPSETAPEATAVVSDSTETIPVILPTEEAAATEVTDPVQETSATPDVIIIPAEPITPLPTEDVIQILETEASQSSVIVPLPQVMVSLASPVPNIPVNFAIIRTPRPTFSWQSVSGATKYDLEVDDSAAFDSPLALNSTNLSGTNFTSSINLAQGSYVWRVTAKDNSGNTSAPSTVMHVTINPAFLPSPNTSIVTNSASTNVVFTWEMTAGSNTYTVQLDEASQANFTTPLALTCTTTGQNCTINVPLGAYVWRVLRSGEVPVGQPVSNAFSVSPAAPPPPHVVNPFNGKYLPPTERPNVPLSWDWNNVPAPAGSPFTYEVQVFASTNFNTPPVSSTTMSTQSATVTLTIDGTYYWRVRAINQFGVVGSWSGTSNFIIDSVRTNAPTMLGPTGDISNARPTFTWTAVPDAYRYQLRVMAGGFSCGSANNNLALLTTGMINGTSYTIPDSAPALIQDEYEVCVVAYDRSENPSNNSNHKQFRVFLGKTPANGAVLPANSKPTFEWSPTANTASVKLKIASDPAFQTLVYTSAALPGWSTYLNLPNALPNGAYYWRVERSSEVITNPSIVRQFFMGQVSLVPGPVLVTPTQNQVVGETAFLTWDDPVLLPGTSIDMYLLEMSNSPTFNTLLFPTFYGDVVGYYEYTAPPNQDHVTYYWRVRGVNGSTPVTEWSTSSFVVDNVAPAKPEITSPSDRQVLSTIRPTITWTAVPSAIFYHIYMYDSYSNFYVDEQVTGTSFTPSVNLVQTWLTVQVWAYDGINASPQDAIDIFLRLGTTPTEGANVLIHQPTFTWENVPGATEYVLQIDDDRFYDAEGSDGDVLRTITLGNVTSYTLTAGQALPDGGYYWRVSHNAYNGGFPTDFKSNFFTINMTLQAPSNLLTKNQFGEADATFISADNVYFEWTAPSLEPVSYDFQVATNSSFAAPHHTNILYGTVYSLDYEDLVNGVNYWRVRARYGTEGTTVGPWSEVKSLTFGG